MEYKIIQKIIISTLKLSGISMIIQARHTHLLSYVHMGQSIQEWTK